MGNLGLATSFFNDKNRNICRDLVALLTESKQVTIGNHVKHTSITHNVYMYTNTYVRTHTHTHTH